VYTFGRAALLLLVEV